MKAQALEIAARLRAEAERLAHQYLGPSQAVGLDIGADTTKAVQVVEAGGRLEVALLGWTPLRSGDIPLSGPEAGQRLRELIEGWGFPTRRLVAGLAGQDCLVRRLKFPFADLKKAARTAPFELEHELPVPVEELVLELFPLSANGAKPAAAQGAAEAGPEAEVSAAAAPEAAQADGPCEVKPAPGLSALALATTRQRLIQRQALLSEAGIAPSAIESDVLALYQAFRALHPEAGQEGRSAVVLDLGARKTTALVVRGHELAAARAIPLGGDAVTAALAAHWQVPFALAERVKRERCSLVAPEEEAKASGRRLEASRVMAAALEPLLQELARTLMACSLQAAPEGEGLSSVPQIGRLYLSGGGSLLAGLAAHLSRRLRCPVQPLAASPHLLLPPGADAAQQALLPTALGLALRRLRKLSPVDFRRSDLAPRQEAKVFNVRLGYIGAVLALCALLGLMGLHVRAGAREARLEALKARAEEIYRGAVPGKGSVPDPVRLLERKLKEAEADPLPDLGGAQEMLEVVRTLAEASGGEGAKVKVTRLAVEAVSAQIEGQADSKETVTRFRMALLKSKLFKDCTVKESGAPAKAGRVSFSLELKRA